MLKRSVLFMVGICLVSLTASEPLAATYNFDDITTANSESVPWPYQGYYWSKISSFDASSEGSAYVIKASQISSWYGITWSYPSGNYGIAIRDELNSNILRIRSSSGQPFNFASGRFRSIGFSNCGATAIQIRAYTSGGSTITKNYSSLPSGSWATLSYTDLTDLTKIEISGTRPSGCNSMWATDDIELVPYVPPVVTDLLVEKADAGDDGLIDDICFIWSVLSGYPTYNVQSASVPQGPFTTIPGGSGETPPWFQIDGVPASGVFFYQVIPQGAKDYPDISTAL